MKPLYIVGNWKSNKVVGEAVNWLQTFASQYANMTKELGATQLVVCVPFSDLYAMKQLKDSLHLPFSLGAQDVSPFPEGAYTGEVSARMVKDLADWVLIGHSERRRYFHETDEELVKETEQAKEAGLQIIYCVPDSETHIPQGVDVGAYEPVWAVGTGKTDIPENANAIISQIKQKTNTPAVLYGGSVTPENVAQFTSQSAIDGVLVGGASLDPVKFLHLIQSATSLSKPPHEG